MKTFYSLVCVSIMTIAPSARAVEYTDQTSVLDMTLNNMIVGNVEYPFIGIASSLLWPGVVEPDRVLSVGQIELNYTDAILKCLESDCFDI